MSRETEKGSSYLKKAGRPDSLSIQVLIGGELAWFGGGGSGVIVNVRHVLVL